MSSLYILDINPLLNILFANVFSHSLGRLFVLLIISFAVQRFLVCYSSICLFFASVSLA